MIKDRDRVVAHTPGVGKRNDVEPVRQCLIDARRILMEKAGDKDGDYANIRYVKMAARIAYRGVLSAIDAYLRVNETGRFIKPGTIEEYRDRLVKQKADLLPLLNAIYGLLYLVAYYHSSLSRRCVENGLATADELLTELAPYTPSEPNIVVAALS